MAQIKELFIRNPYREITSVIRITDHDPRRVWTEMDEYVPTERVLMHYRDILDVLADTRRGATERVCIWISGFFGSGKSHFLKVLGYLLGKRSLRDPDGHIHSSCEFLCRKLRQESFLPLLEREISTKVLFINLLDYDPQDPRRPTISRRIYQQLLEEKDLSKEFWVAEWEMEFQRLEKWDTFREWVKEKYGRTWEEERRLNAEIVLTRALPELLSDRYHNQEEARQTIENNKRVYATISPSDLILKLCQEAKNLHPHNGRFIVLLDEVGLYIGDSIERLTDLNALAEQVVQQGDGKVLLIATAQEALTDLVPRLTADRQILEWLRDRFRLRLGLEPTEVQAVVASRLLAKKSDGINYLKSLYRSHQGTLLSNLSIERPWSENDFIERYPFSPYAVKLVQDIMGALRGSIEEAKRLSGSERSILKVSHAILTGEGGIIRGADQEVGWLVSLDLFYDALAPDLTAIRAEQVRVIRELESLGAVDGLSIARLSKAMFLLQHLRLRYPCSIENLASALVDQIETDINHLRQAVDKGLKLLMEKGWVVEEEGQYRLLTPAEHDLEKDVRANYPTPARLKQEAVNLVREMFRKFTVELGQIKRPIKVALTADGETIFEEGDLTAELFTPFAEESYDDVLKRSVSEPNTVFWRAESEGDIKSILERTVAIGDTLEQWSTRALSPQQEEHRSRLEKEAHTSRQTRLPQVLQQTFLRGRIFKGGQEINPAGNDMISILRAQLQSIASQRFTEFVDERPEREDDCAVILSWQPGAFLPTIFTRLGLLTTNNQIHQENQLLFFLKAEIRNRKQKGLPRTGKDLSEYFEKIPFGWDSRLVRLLLSTLFKLGLINVRYQNRDLKDPTDAQARQVFQSQREFNKTVFDLLPEVDWRKASEICSTLFGVSGGDTFERTANIVGEQARLWEQEAQQLSVRCQDNGLPPTFGEKCQKVARALNEIVQRNDPNACLRKFLEISEDLGNEMPVVRNLKAFPFDEYRKVRNFILAVNDWAAGLKGEAGERWKHLSHQMSSINILQGWSQVREDYSFLLSRYREDYSGAHRDFQSNVQKGLEEARNHPAFHISPERAEDTLQPLKMLSCSAEDHTPDESNFRCTNCQRQYISLSSALVLEVKRKVEAVLDELLPKPPIEKIQPLSIRQTVSQQKEIDNIADELSRYWRKTQRPIDVQIHAQVKEDSK